MSDERVVSLARAGLRSLCTSAGIDDSHGIIHAERVLAHAERALLSASPPIAAEPSLAVRLAALLHDADDRKYFGTHVEGTPPFPNAAQLMRTAGANPSVTADALQMISYVSCSANGNSVPHAALSRPEVLWPRWADRLETAGCIGVLRCYQYNRRTGAPLSLPTTPRACSAEEAWALATTERFQAYQESGGGSASMIDHFYDKLLQVSRPPAEMVKNPYLEAAAVEGTAPLLDVLLKFGREGEVPVQEIEKMERSLSRTGA